MKNSIIHIIVFHLMMSFLVVSCSEDITNGTMDPSDLNFVVTISPEGTGEITISSTAKDAVEYHFLLGPDEQLIEKNQTGQFSYTFNQSGTYQIQIRAYGESGRYIKKEKQISVVVGSDAISLENGYTTPLTYDGYKLIWNDEFNDDVINSNNWSFETGDGCPNLCGWGNNELQYYRKKNAWTEGGVLTIEARKEVFGGKSYTSTRMKSQGKQSFQYGRIDIRALLPKGKGIWPALWMLGNKITSTDWPACGEIDIMEMIGGDGNDNTVHGTVHYEKDNNHTYHGNGKTLNSGIFADEYHVFSIVWNENSITWYMDDEEFYSVDITPSYMSEFHQEFFFIFNIAVGGNWPGAPDETTIFPQQMKIDYVRVFKPI